MNLDTKRSEICKLEERAQQRENALQRSEEMLEEDAMKFDAFLKENDHQVQQALKRADHEAKKKQEKIKQLNAEMTAIRSEMNKYEEHMENVQQYKEFLDGVTPTEWFEEQKKKQEKQREERLEYWNLQCEAIRKRKSEALIVKNKAEEEYSNARTQQEAEIAERKLREAAETLKATRLLKEPTKPTEEELNNKQGNEEETYFKSPQQLLNHYNALEEQNLFLIQNLQEIEEALDRNRGKLVEVRRTMDEESERQKTQLKKLKELARVKKQHHHDAKHLDGYRPCGFNNAKNKEAVSWDQLHHQLKKAYHQSGFVADKGVDVLTMLTNIEMRLEDYLRRVQQLPKDCFEKSERAREKERRHKGREEKQEQLKREHEARIHRALQRAAAPAFKKSGKPQMFRSIIPIKKKIIIHNTQDDDSLELKEFLSKQLI